MFITKLKCDVLTWVSIGICFWSQPQMAMSGTAVSVFLLLYNCYNSFTYTKKYFLVNQNASTFHKK